MIDAADLGFDGFVDLLRQRMGDADALEPSRIHSFKDHLISDVANVPATWYDDAYQELDAQGHIGIDGRTFGDVAARLSADGKHYLRTIGMPT
jgi:hypothetical protein